MKFYPITFSPILKDRIWGGTKLKSYLHKNSDSQTTGESWEISTVPGDISVVNSVLLKCKNINEIIELYPEEILGKSLIAQFGKQFQSFVQHLQIERNSVLTILKHDK